PAGVYEIVVRVGRAGGRGETQEQAIAFGDFVCGVAASGKELDLALLQAKILRRLVGKKLVAVGDDQVIQLMQVFFKLLLRAGEIAVDQWPAPRPLHAPLQRADD